MIRAPSRDGGPTAASRERGFVRRPTADGAASQERIQRASVHNTAAQRWFSMIVKQGGIRRIRQRYVNDLQTYKRVKATTKAFDDERNADFNRYTDVPLLDETRVRLKKGPDGVLFFSSRL